MKKLRQIIVSLLRGMPLILIALISLGRTIYGMEMDTDRPGIDYKRLTLDAKFCEDECKKDPNCKAWTYVKPGTTQGPDANCWLKSAVPSPVVNTCCISGYKGGLPPVSTQGDLAAWDWCYYVNENIGQIKFYPIVKNVGPSAWASAKEGFYKIGVGAGTYPYNFPYMEEKHTLAAFPYWWLEKGATVSLPEGIAVTFHPNNTYSLKNIWLLNHTEDTNPANDSLKGDIGVFQGKDFLPTGKLYGKICK